MICSWPHNQCSCVESWPGLWWPVSSWCPDCSQEAPPLTEAKVTACAWLWRSLAQYAATELSPRHTLLLSLGTFYSNKATPPCFLSLSVTFIWSIHHSLTPSFFHLLLNPTSSFQVCSILSNYTPVFVAKHSHELHLLTVSLMVNCMCPHHGATEYWDSWLNMISGCVHEDVSRTD